jgi:predicted HicB family RNase H-like nuclease
MRKKTLIRQLAVSVSEETWKKILESTSEAEVSISEWIREAIEEKLFAAKKGEGK